MAGKSKLQEILERELAANRWHWWTRIRIDGSRRYNSDGPLLDAPPGVCHGFAEPPFPCRGIQTSSLGLTASCTVSPVFRLSIMWRPPFLLLFRVLFHRVLQKILVIVNNFIKIPSLNNQPASGKPFRQLVRRALAFLFPKFPGKKSVLQRSQ